MVSRCLASLPLLWALLSGGAAYAQTTSPGTSGQYFPMDLDNEWTYYQLLDPPGQPLDTVFTGTFRFRERIETGGETYFTFDFGRGRLDTLRADEQGRIWHYFRGDEVLLFDFTLDDGQSYTYAPYAERDLQYDVRVQKGHAVDVEAGHFENCVSFSFDDPEWMDVHESFTFAPGVGIVAWHTAWDGGLLYSARVGGEVITALEEGAQAVRGGFELSSYPNPFNDTATLELFLDHPGQVRLTVFDALGRKVREEGSGFFEAGRHTFSFEGEGLSGAYFIRAQVGVRTAVLPVLRVR